MVIELKKSTVAYRCPSCCAGVISIVDCFKLNADMVRLKCRCGKSEMTIVRSKDKKVRFTVPCLVCPNPHHFTVSEELFYDKELFVLPCQYTGINIAMMGDFNHVKAELARTELALLDLINETGDGHLMEMYADTYLSDPQVLEVVKFVVAELAREGSIYCNCPEGTEGDYEVDMSIEGLRVTCLNCGATKIVATNSIVQAADFLRSDSLTLE